MNKKEETLIDLAKDFASEMGQDPTSVNLPEPDKDRLKTANADLTPPVEIPPKNDEGNKAIMPVASEGNSSEILKELLAKTVGKSDWVDIRLPSRGLAYVNSPDVVQVRAFRFEEEKALRSITTTEKGTKVITQVLSQCIKGINYTDLTLSDKNYILFQIRKLSYGDAYKIEAVCSNCEEKNKLTLQIDNIPVNYAPDNYSEPLELMLPDSEQLVKFVSARVLHETRFQNQDGIMDNIHILVTEIGGHRDPYIIQNFIKETTVRDISTLVNTIFKPIYGMDQTITYKCAHCGTQAKGEIGLDQGFFSPS